MPEILLPLYVGIASATPTASLIWHMGHMFWCADNLITNNQSHLAPNYFLHGFVITGFVLLLGALIFPVLTYQHFWKAEHWKIHIIEKIIFICGWLLCVSYAAISLFF